MGVRMSSVILYHATPKNYWRSIRREGLDPERAQGKQRKVWLHSKSNQAWAALHCADRHGTDIADMVVLQVIVPRSWLTMAPRRGRWTCSRLVERSRIVCLGSAVTVTE